MAVLSAPIVVATNEKMVSEDPEPGARPLRKGERTRLRILHAAGQLFATRRPADIRLEDIAHEAGVSTATIYNYFPNREALLLALMADAYDAMDEHREEMRALPSPMARVYRAGELYLDMAIRRPAFVRFMMTRGLQPSGDPELAEINALMAGRLRQMVLESGADLHQAMQAGEIPVAPVDEMIVMMFALWNGLAGLIVRADQTAIPPDLALRAVERSRLLLRRAVAHEFEHEDAPPASWERPS